MANTGSTILFNTDFAAVAAKPLVGAKWSVVNGQLVPPVTGGSVAFGDTSWTDVQLDVSATISSGSGYGVYFRADGKSKISGYCFQYDPGVGNKFIVRKVVAGVESAPIAQVKFPAGFSVYDAQPRDHHQRRRQPHRLQGRRRQHARLQRQHVRLGRRRSALLGQQRRELHERQGAHRQRGRGRQRRREQGRLRLRLRRARRPPTGWSGWLAGDGAFVIQPLQ